MRAVLFGLLVSAPALADQVKPRILLDFDVSMSMVWDTCGVTDRDDSAECTGSDNPCATCNAEGCDNGIFDDSRLWKVKKATTAAVSSFGEVEFALARLHEDPATFSCPSGGWFTSTRANCDGNPVGVGLNTGDILVKFPTTPGADNQVDLIEWLDGCDNWPTTDDCDPVTNLAPPTGCQLCDDCGGGCDKELRGTWGTALGGSMWSVRRYLMNDVIPDDAYQGCRPYAVILLTDGEETCGGAPATRAAELCADGVMTYVIGFAAPSLQAGLNNIANSGCAPECDPNYGTPEQSCRETAIMVENETDLALAFADIIQGSVLVETCNGEDDDCDGLVDEDFPGLGEACCDPCPGIRVCNAQGNGTTCSGESPCPEVCDMEDNDCDGLVDEFLNCVYEVCNGIDDDRDGETDELPLPGLGAPCGSNEGECSMGVTCCARNGTFACCGADGPEREVCDCLDNNCNGLTDEAATRRCYTGSPSECPDPDSGACLGICRPGNQVCVADSCPTPSYGPCFGELGPRPETCNCVDDNCNGVVDDGATCANGLPCVNCNCAPPCDPGDEFPCPAGLICTGSCGGVEPHYCVPAPCNGVLCDPGATCDECTGVCIDPCAEAPCGDLACCAGTCCQKWESCEDRGDGDLVCVDTSCTNPMFPCATNEVCEDHECVSDPCEGVPCAADEFCRGGECLSVCPRCDPGTRCEGGRCVPDPCADTICSLANTVCCDGQCINDPCIAHEECPAGEYCDPCTGSCRIDLCLVTDCPSGYHCRVGDCFPGADPKGTEIAVTGVGGCACRTAETDAPPPWPFLLLLIVLGTARLVLRRSAES